MLLFFAFFCSLVHLFLPQCIPYPPFTCLQCESDYYDQNFLIDFRLSYSKSYFASCQLKIPSTYSQKILITNSPSCLNENITSYDACYTSPLIAFQTENRKLLSFNNSKLAFEFTPGNHFLLKLEMEYTNENLFRQSNTNITL